MSSTPFIGISRNRLATDGAGVTTLAAFWGCPLSCRHCLNPQSIDKKTKTESFTPEELYERVKIDELYFLATGGGITFGGGEPCLYADFIKRFRLLCGPEWTISIETSLNISFENMNMIYPYVDYYIVDIKDMNNEIYQRYTGKENTLPIANLKWLIGQGKAENIRVRVPKIPDFNTDHDIENSIQQLKIMGIQTIDIFSYIIKN